MAKKRASTEQASLFGEVQLRSLVGKAAPKAPPRAAKPSKWKMPETEGSTVAEVRLRWNRRLTPAQVARVEGELASLPRLLGKLGFGAVLVERAFVRRRSR